MAETASPTRRIVSKELALLLVLVLFGLILLPIAVFFVGNLVFGDYGPAGFSGFFNTLGGKLRSGDWVAWFLVLSPYLAWQTIRLTAFLWRRLGTPRSTGNTPGKQRM